MRESDIRTGDYAYKGTMITAEGEMDIYLADNTGSRIQVTMKPEAADAEQLVYGDIRFGPPASAPAGDIRVLDDAGQEMDSDRIEALAFEMIEGSAARVLEYAYGRTAIRLENGERAAPGEEIHDRGVFDDEILDAHVGTPEMT